MGVNSNDYMECNACRKKEYCTLFLKCEVCGHVDKSHVEIRKQQGWD